MGGAKSKYEETDWIQADGKLKSAEETIDGRPPTAQYGVYYVTKTKMNQREFDVTDLEQNLLYTTKCVPGTLCWFDVYGRGLGERLLRVQVDLSRRYWIVYRMGVPCFEGQLADVAATEKLANDTLAAGDKTSATAPFLFRKCCITVSWSRYMAVAMHYGPPAEGSTLNDNQSDTDDDDDYNKILVDKAEATIASSSGGVPENTNNQANGSAEIRKGNQQPTQNRITSWMKQKSQSFIQDKESKKRERRSDPREGVIHLERPILLCQEIYNKFIGNHQTSTLSKTKAIELLRQDLEQHMKDGGTNCDDAFLTDQEAIFAQLNQEAGGKSDLTLDSVDNNEHGDHSARIEGVAAQPEHADVTCEHQQASEMADASKLNAVSAQHNTNEPERSGERLETNEDGWGADVLEASSTISTKEDEPQPNSEEDDSIIAYWKWENTWKTQQIKMHLGAGSDLALHVVLAIIANQVRYERNAIAMTM